MIYDVTAYKPNRPNNLIKFFDFSDKKEEDFIMENISKLVTYLQKNVDWNKVVSVVNNVPTKYNDREKRYFKSDIIQTTVEIFSNGKLKFVGGIGYDFIVTDENSMFDNCKIELKTGQNIFSYKETFDIKRQKKSKPPKTSSIKMNNSQGSSLKKSFERKFDYLLLIDKCGSAITSFDQVKKYVKNDGDGYSAAIPIEELQVICLVEKNNISVRDINVNDVLREATLKIIYEIVGKP